jgi:MoxR-like ATPase
MNFKNDVEALDALRNKFDELKNEITRVIYGQDEVVTQVLISLFSQGHVLLIGVPGLAKTLLVTTIAKILGIKI